MQLLRKPTPEVLTTYLHRQAAAPLSYDFAGATRGLPDVPKPAGFVHDHRRTLLAQGEHAWQAARAAVDAWAMFQTGWTTLFAPRGAPRPGHAVALVIWYAGLWWVNPTRVLYAIDEEPAASSNGLRRFGFGYGTLAEHVERGEERFLIEQDAAGNVWYDLTAFSRPRHLLVRVANPLTRRLQKAFARDSAAAMIRAVVEQTTQRADLTTSLSR